MRKFFILLNREIKSYFYSPIGYVVLVFFLMLSGFFFHKSVSLLNQEPAPMTIIELYFWLFSLFGFILIFPLITMRIFAEEFKMGTIETLMTAPVGDLQVVLSKFFGAVFFYVVLLAPSLLYFKIFEAFTDRSAAGAMGAYGGAYLLMFLLGTFYISIGCLASVLTRNQVIAAMISFCAIAILFYSGLFAGFVTNMGSAMRDFVAYFSAREHVIQFSQGIIDTRPLVFYVTMTTLMLTLTYHVFQYRKWKL